MKKTTRTTRIVGIAILFLFNIVLFFVGFEGKYTLHISGVLCFIITLVFGLKIPEFSIAATFCALIMHQLVLLFPKHYGTGLVALQGVADLILPFIVIIFETVGFVLARLISYAVSYTIHNPNDDHSLSLNNGWLKTAAEKTAKYVESFNCDNTELVHSLSEFANKNNKNELSQQINDAVVFIDGAITRYELEDITTSEHCNKESRELDFYCCYPKYLVKTDTNKEYSFTFCYHCLWTKHEDCTGIGSIRIEDKASGESIAIGYFEYPYGDY